jgi:hypothetical protein
LLAPGVGASAREAVPRAVTAAFGLCVGFSPPHGGQGLLGTVATLSTPCPGVRVTLPHGTFTKNLARVIQYRKMDRRAARLCHGHIAGTKVTRGRTIWEGSKGLGLGRVKRFESTALRNSQRSDALLIATTSRTKPCRRRNTLVPVAGQLRSDIDHERLACHRNLLAFFAVVGAQPHDNHALACSRRSC